MVQLNDTFGRLALSDAPPPAKAPRARPGVRFDASASPTLPESTNRLLSLLARLFIPLRLSPQFTPTLQRVKGLLYDKEYLTAFGSPGDEGERFREVYVSRWTPARAVIYERIFEECAVAYALGWAFEQPKEVDEEEKELQRERKQARRRREWKKEGKTKEEIAQLEAQAEADAANSTSQGNGAKEVPEEYRVAMLGAGAGSEVVALGCCLGTAASAPSERKRPRVKVDVVDQGGWGTLLQKMEGGLREEWPALSPSSAGEGGFEVTFEQADALAPPTSASPPAPASASPTASYTPPQLAHPSTRLITILFTISELFLQSRLSTLRLLSSLSSAAPGTLLLIVESASLGMVPLGKEGRMYPLGTLLDHTLCDAGAQKGQGNWEKLKGEDAKWYRMMEGAEDAYNPLGSGERVKLENSRVVLRLYRRK
ncbi:hypothetical protein JCM10213_006911 [Rhodosporidiobolus nylandii]